MVNCPSVLDPRPCLSVTDLTFALRALGRHRGFSAIAVVMLAVGIGANSAIFSLVDAVMMKPPAGVAQPERVVWISAATPTGRLQPMSYLDYVDAHTPGAERRREYLRLTARLLLQHIDVVAAAWASSAL